MLYIVIYYNAYITNHYTISCNTTTHYRPPYTTPPHTTHRYTPYSHTPSHTTHRHTLHTATVTVSIARMTYDLKCQRVRQGRLIYLFPSHLIEGYHEHVFSTFLRPLHSYQSSKQSICAHNSPTTHMPNPYNKAQTRTYNNGKCCNKPTT